MIVTRKSLIVVRNEFVINKNKLGEIFRSIHIFHLHNPKKEAPGMISPFKYLLRFIISLCITIAVIFVMACVALVIYIALKGGIKIRMISEDEEIK